MNATKSATLLKQTSLIPDLTASFINSFAPMIAVAFIGLFIYKIASSKAFRSKKSKLKAPIQQNSITSKTASTELKNSNIYPDPIAPSEDDNNDDTSDCSLKNQ